MEKTSEATLHGGIRRLAKRLKDGDSVVLDDCNPTAGARTSLMAALRKQGADFILEGVEFRPKGGLLQCRVVAQFMSAAEAERIEGERLTLSVDIDSSDESDSGDDEDGTRHAAQSKGSLLSLLSVQDHTLLERRREDILKVRDFLFCFLTYL